jgi:hypothetical protein
MASEKIAIPTDVYDKDGNMTKIEFNDVRGEHIIDAVWDSRDKQTSENRIEFRKWAYRQLDQQGFRVLK